MTFPVVGSNIPSTYQISNSLRFNDGDSPSLTRTPGSASNRDTFTTSFWFKRGILGTGQRIWSAGTSIGTNNNDLSSLLFESNDTLKFFGEVGGSPIFTIQTNQVFRDVSAWYHIVLAVDTTQATASNRVKIYINGSQITSFSTASYMSQNQDTYYNAANLHVIGYQGGGGYPDGYYAEFHHVNGSQLSPTDFGEFDEDSGVWKPKQYAGTYGTNGFYLKFNNSGNMGEDSSGNDNTFTPTNLSGTTDVTTDTPTNNFANLNPLDNDSATTFSEGNTKFVTDSTERRPFYSTYGLTTGKWYWEVKGTVNTAVGYLMIGIAGSNNTATEPLGNNLYDYSYRPDSGNIFNNGSSSSYGNTFTDNDIIGIALDLDNNKLYFSKNGTFQNSGDPTSGATGTGAVSITDPSSTDKGCYMPSASDFWTGGGITGFFNFGNPSFSISSGNSDDNGYGNFEYAPPSGYLALCTQNLATELSPTIDDGSQYFNTVLYSGNSSTQSITGVGFQPDWTWIKARNQGYDHQIYDSGRGVELALESNTTGTETTRTDGLTSFDADGFALGSHIRSNNSTDTYASWNWKANGGTTSSNTDGSITSTVQSNTTAGFSIVTWTGTGANATVGHNLGVKPDMIITKNRDLSTGDWVVYHSAIGATKILQLNQNTGEVTRSIAFNDTEPTSSVFSVGTWDSANGNGNNMVSYAFAEIEGYSKINSFEGNNSTDGSFVYTGFRPHWVMIKSIDSTDHWNIPVFTSNANGTVNTLSPNLSNAERTMDQNPAIDFLSNGFKLRTSDNNYNGSNTYIYYAIASNPFVTSGATPVTAR